MYSKFLSRFLLMVALIGFASQSSLQATTPTKVNFKKVAQLATVFLALAGSSYLTLKQDEQPVLENGSTLDKLINWYRRVVCGNISKKKQVIQPNGEIKDTYTKANGLLGRLISWYDANEKDVKKAAAIGALFTIGTVTTNIFDVLGGVLKSAPYSEFVSKVPTDTLTQQIFA